MSVSETIFALATPPGQSAIAIIRISGPCAHEVLEIFGVENTSEIESPIAQYQRLKGMNGAIVDDVMLLLFPSSSSPTGECVSEIQCHGSHAVVQILLSQLANVSGLRPAQPGEFSRRAFANGKMGLIDLEGLADLIDAQTSLQHKQAMNVMTGRLSSKFSSFREVLISISSRLETIIDFSDEDLPNDVVEGHLDALRELQNQIINLVETSKISEQIREGVKIALIGPVNAGKSTILNALARRDIAIVSSIAGTTRDILEVKLDLGGIPVVLADTAGIRESEDVVEIEGIKRAKKAAQDSDLTILVLDVSNPNWICSLPEFEKWSSSQKLIVLNKADLVSNEQIKQSIQNSHLSIFKEVELIITNFKNKDFEKNDANYKTEIDTDNSADLLIEKLSDILSYINVTNTDLRLTRSWHKSACLSVSRALERAINLNVHQEPELVAEELRYAHHALGRLTGEVAVDDLLDNIFSSFCIGK